MCCLALFEGRRPGQSGRRVCRHQGRLRTNFKNGEDRIDIRTGHISPLSNDLVLADGEVDIFFKNDKGETNKLTFFWTGVDIRENGQMKVRMLTAAPKPEPTKEASADKK